MTSPKSADRASVLQAQAVTRRRFVAWLGAGAATVAAGPLLSGCTPDLDSVAGNDTNAGAGPETRTLQFSIPALPASMTSLVLGVQGAKYPLQAHTVQTRAQFAGANPLGVDTSQLTHFVTAPMPGNGIVEFSIWGTDSKAATAGIPVKQQVTWTGAAAGTEVFGQTPGNIYVGGGINIPQSALRTVITAAQHVKPLSEVYATDVRLAAFGINAVPDQVEAAMALFDLHDTPIDIAGKLVYKAPGVANLSPAGAAIVLSIINSNQQEMVGLANAVNTMLTNIGVYGSTDPQIANANGDPIYVSATGAPGTGPAANVFNPFLQDGTQYMGQTIPSEWTTALRTNLAQTAKTVMGQCQDALNLEQTQQGIQAGNGGNWVVSDGATPQVIPASQATELANKLGVARVGANPVTSWTVTPSGFNSGIKVELNGTPSPGSGGLHAGPGASPSPTPSPTGGGTNVPLRIYNNNELFYSIYAQMWQGNTQLSLGGANVNSNDYTGALGSIATVLVVLGVPIFDTNWTDITLPIAAGATKGQLLLCTLGSGTGWKDYFKDSNGNQLYSGSYSPPECTSANIFTAIVNLGLPFVMLLADAVGFSAISKLGSEIFDSEGPAIAAAMQPVLKALQGVQAFQGILDLFLVGQQMDAAITNWGSSSPTQLFVPLARLLMLILVQKALAPILTALLADEAAARIADAIPIVGEVYAGVALLADAATLMTSVCEVINLPFVTPIQVSGSYNSTVTIAKDPSDSTFPKTATSWTLQVQILGDGSLPAIQETSFSWQSVPNDGASFTQNVPSVPVGSMINYTIQFQDVNGWKVGAGSTGWIDNADISNLPSPTITISEIEPPMGSQTTFGLNATTQWDPDRSGGAGYTWSDQTTVPDTIQYQEQGSGKLALPAAGSLAVGTVTGRVGYVYKTEDGWLVNQVASTADPNSGAASTGTVYSAQPQLVYDGVGTLLTGGLNFLIEPYEDISGYLVRQVDLSQPDFGLVAVGSAPITVHGRLLGEVDGAALHPSGYVVAYNSTTGRMQSLRLPSTTYPLDMLPSDAQICDLPSPRVFGGTGNQTGARPGLVQQPVGIAMGLNGVVFVLEQGAQRIQAFNVTGSPTPYFTVGGNTQNPSYYLDLTKTIPNTKYLGIGVDGAGWIYVHGYQGDGSQVSDYGVSVFKADGTNVVQFATGVNASQFAVDYWRDLYTQDFGPMQQTSGGAYIGPSGVAQPAVSIWVPNTPPGPTASATAGKGQ